MDNFLKGLSSVAVIILLVFLCFSLALPKDKISNAKKIEAKNAVVDFCKENGGKHLDIIKNDGSSVGVCNFNDGSSCDDWEFFVRKCQKGTFNNETSAENSFSITKVLDITCDDETSTCETPAEYMTRSDCPYETRCLENKCTVVCPETQKISSESTKNVYCEDDSYALDCVCKEGHRESVKCPDKVACTAVVQYECVK